MTLSDTFLRVVDRIWVFLASGFGQTFGCNP